jgi:DNA-binding IclR family transcriptional regulator
MSRDHIIQPIIKAEAIMDVLFLNFAVGFTLTEVSEKTGLNISTTHRYIQTLMRVGLVEEILDTKRYRPSHKWAQRGVQSIHSLNEMEKSAQSSLNRLTRI